jgi:hypothetical protein
MKLTDLHETSEPEGYKHGDPCPACGSELRNKYTTMGAPSGVICRNKHLFSRIPSKKKTEMADFDPSEFWGQEEEKPAAPSVEHTCRIQYRKPEDEDWSRRNQRRCAACAQEYEDELDLGFIGDVPDDVEVEPEVGDVDISQRIKDLIKYDPRQDHRAGKFGTGHAAALTPYDSPVMAGLKARRDKHSQRNEVTGRGKVMKYKDRCGLNHTCHSHPSGKPAQNYPIPDPVATRTTGKQRYNWMFQYSPLNTFEWPVSKMVGFEPKDKYRDYVMSKLECPVCSGEKEGCDNSVAQEYGAPKPFCSEHLSLSPYPKELTDKYGDFDNWEHDPSSGAQFRTWIRDREKLPDFGFRKGDRVVVVNGQGQVVPSWGESGGLVGTIIEIDSEMADRTFHVEWDNPKGGDAAGDDPGSKAAAANRKRQWVNPQGWEFKKGSEAFLKTIYHSCEWRKQKDGSFNVVPSSKKKCDACKLGEPDTDRETS